MRLLTLLLMLLLIVTLCGCIGTKPSHDFEINETRSFAFTYDGIDYGGNLRWDGEHFHIAANGHGYKDGLFVVVHIHGVDDDALFQISSAGMPPYVEQHVDFSRTVLLDKMIRNRVDKPGTNGSR